jgi:hypothetical protein
MAPKWHLKWLCLRLATELFDPPCLFVGHEPDQGGSRPAVPGTLGLQLPKDRLRLGSG